MDVRLPDGTIINNVPDNITQTELLARLKKAGYDVDTMMSGKKPEEAPAKKEPERTLGGYAKEAVKGLIPGLVGMGETAITGAASLLPEGAEQAIRKPTEEFAAGVRETFAPAPGYEDTVARKLGEAVGSTIPFLPLGALGAAGRAAVAGLSVATGAGESRQRAEQAGATEGERGVATALGTIPGALESLPPVRILRRFGFGEEAVKEVAGFIPALTRVAKAGGEEALQEASSQVLQNLIAKGVYKPDEAVLGGVGEAAGLGGGAGAVVSAIAELALGRRLRGAQPAAPEEAPEEPAPPEAPETPAITTPPNATQESIDAARDYVNKVASGEAKFNWMVGRKLLKAMNAEIPEGAKAADIRNQLESMFPAATSAAPAEEVDLESLIGGEFADTEVPSGRRGRGTTPAETVVDASGRSVDVSTQRPATGEPAVTGVERTGLETTTQPSVQPVSGEEVVEPSLEEIEFDNGDKYRGLLDDKSRPSGKGVYTTADGHVFEGEFTKGKLNGLGSLSFPDGSFYEGQFKNDKFHGDGVFKDADGTVMQGQFKNGTWLGEVETTPAEAAPEEMKAGAEEVPSLREDATDEEIQRYVEARNKQQNVIKASPQISAETKDFLTSSRKRKKGKRSSINEIAELLSEHSPAEPEAVDYEEGRTDELGSSQEVIKAEPGMNVKRMAKMVGPQIYGDPSNMGVVTIKEILQNSFDSIKGMIDKNELEKGRINISTDKSNRVIRMTDNGRGMTPHLLGTRFLEIAGTGKDATTPSGGFGIAKMLFLYGNKGIKVTTMRDGKVAEMVTTGQQLYDSLEDKDQAPNIYIRTPTEEDNALFPEGHGTDISLTIPEDFDDIESGQKKPIRFVEYSDGVEPLVHSPLFANIDVTFENKIWQDKETLNIGSAFPYNDYSEFTNVKFPWGSARVYVRPAKQSEWGPNMHILSNGLYQFSTNVKKEPLNLYSDKVPYTFYVDIKPTVKPEDAGYPFTLNRKGFTELASKDFSKIKTYIDALYAYKNLSDSAKSFGEIQYFDSKDSLTPPVEVKPTVPPKADSIFGIQEGDKVTVENGIMFVRGKELPELTPDQLRAGIPDSKELKVDPSMIDSSRVMLHDNLKMKSSGQPFSEYMREQYGTSYDRFLFDIGDVFLSLRNEVAELLQYPELRQEAVGISMDPEYRGVSIRVPFNGSFVNPFATRSVNTAEAAYGALGTMVHELAHFKVRSHNSEFPAEMQFIDYKMQANRKQLWDAYQTKLINTFNEHQDIFENGWRLINESGSVEARGERFKDGSREDAGKPKDEGVSAGKRGPSGAGRAGERVQPSTQRGGKSTGKGGAPGQDSAANAGKSKVTPARVSAEKDVAETVGNRKKAFAAKHTKEGLVKRIRKYMWGDEAGANRLDLYERAVKTFQNELRPLEEWERSLRRASETIVGLPGFNNVYTLITNAQDKAAFYSSMLLKRPMDNVHKAIESYARMRNITTDDAMEELDRLRIIKHEPERRAVLFMLTAPLSKKRRTFKTASGKTMRASPAEIRKLILEQLVKPGVRLSPQKSQDLRKALNSIIADKKNLDPLGDSPLAKEGRPLSIDINSADYNVFGGYSPEFVKKLAADYDKLGPNVRGSAEKVLAALKDVQERTRQLNQEGKYWSNSVSNIVDFYGFNFYTPFKGRSGTERSAITDPNDRRISGEFAQADQAMEGRESEADNSVLQDLSDAMYAAARAGRAGVTEAVKNSIEQGHIKGEKVATITPAQRYLDREFDMRPFKGTDKIFHYDNDGNIEVYKIKSTDQKLLDTIRRPYQETNWAVKMANGLTGFFGQMHTRFNPSFAPLNFPRDVFTNSLTIASDLGGKQAARYFTDALLTNVMKGGLRKSYKISRMLAAGDEAGLKKLAATSDFARDTLEYLEKGGRTAYQQAYNISAQADIISKNLNRNGVVAASQKGLESVADLMDSYNDAFEFTNRVAAYTMARNNAEATMKQEFRRRNKRAPNASELQQIKEAAMEEGATLAKNLANFRLVGTAGREAGALFMFFRTAATGAARAVDAMLPALVSYETALERAPESVRKNPEAAQRFKANYEANKKRAMWTMFLTAAAGAFLYELGLAFADDDEEGRNRVATDDMARWTRYARLPVLGKDTFLQIPWGFGISAFGAWGAQIAAVAHGNSAPKDLAANGINIAFDSFIPLPKSNINVFDNFAGFLVDSVAPTSIRPFVEYAMNTDNLGNDIYNSRQSRYSDVFTGGSNIPEFYKTLAKDYYEMTGFEVSPNTVYFWASNYADALSRVATSVYDLRMFASGQREFRSVDDLDKVVPFIDSFIGTKSNYDARQFSAVEKQIKEKEQRLNSIKNRPDDYTNYVEKNPLDKEIVSLYNRQINRRLKDLREQANYIRTTSELTPQEKRDMLKDNTRMQNMAKRDIIDTFKIYYGIEPK